MKGTLTQELRGAKDAETKRRLLQRKRRLGAATRDFEGYVVGFIGFRTVYGLGSGV